MRQAGRVAAKPEFAEWYAEVSADLNARISHTVGDPVLGREATAEAFARAYENWSRVQQMDSPEGWVYNTAVNLCRRSWRRRAIERRAVKRLESGAPSEVLDKHDEHDLVAGYSTEGLDGMVAELPDRMKQAVQLRYWDGLTEAEVAQEMAIAPGGASATTGVSLPHRGN